MAANDTVMLTPVYAWRCPACGADRVERPRPAPESDFPPEVVRMVRRRWGIPQGTPIPADKLSTWPREVTCGACGVAYFAERGELTNPSGN